MPQFKSFRLVDNDGNRKYIDMPERRRFYNALLSVPIDDQCFGKLFFLTGVRISEGNAVRVKDIDLDLNMVSFKSLKKRNKIDYRRIPLPSWFVQELNDHYSIEEKQKNPNQRNERIWTWSRATASRHIKKIMDLAMIKGKHANSRGLRHSFGLICARANVPASAIQEWMGHEDISTTMIYMRFAMSEQREFAERLWKDI